jgi:hypothetical protein
MRSVHRIASLRFQPTKRPQLSAQKSKPKASTQKPSTTAPLSAPISLDPIDVAVRPPAKTTLAAWTADGEDNDVNGFYGGEKRQRGGRKKRKKTKEESHVPQNWDDIYDPSRPNNYEEYKNSDEKIIEIREWKDRLYAHRMANRRGSDSDSSDGYNVSQSRSTSSVPVRLSRLIMAQRNSHHLRCHSSPLQASRAMVDQRIIPMRSAYPMILATRSDTHAVHDYLGFIAQLLCQNRR